MSCESNLCSSNNCSTIVSSNCISYQGDTDATLGICKGTTLTCILETLFDQINTQSDGSGIVLTGINTNCTFISTQMAGKTGTIFNYIQTLIDSACTLNSNYESLSAIVESSYSYNLQGIVTATNGTTSSVLQGTINALADVSDTVGEITTGLGTTSILDSLNSAVGNALINNISGEGVVKTGSGASAQINIVGIVPPYCPIPCYAPLSFFNSDGSGKSGTSYEGWYICDGQASRLDMRGYVFGGATNLPGLNSPTLQSAVNSTVSGDPDYQTSVGQRKGEVKHGLTVSEMPSHTVSGTTDPHNHTVYGTTDLAGGESYQSYNVMTDNGTSSTSSETVNFTSDPIGSNVKHENRQPTFYGYFIMRIS